MKNKKHFMRNNQIYTGLVVFILGVFAVGAARAQPQQPSYNQGLLSKLIEIKYTYIYSDTYFFVKRPYKPCVARITILW